jgi:hypothetical protein
VVKACIFSDDGDAVLDFLADDQGDLYISIRDNTLRQSGTVRIVGAGGGSRCPHVVKKALYELFRTLTNGVKEEGV